MFPPEKTEIAFSVAHVDTAIMHGKDRYSQPKQAALGWRLLTIRVRIALYPIVASVVTSFALNSSKVSHYSSTEQTS